MLPGAAMITIELIGLVWGILISIACASVYYVAYRNPGGTATSRFIARSLARYSYPWMPGTRVRMLLICAVCTGLAVFGIGVLVKELIFR